MESLWWKSNFHALLCEVSVSLTRFYCSSTNIKSWQPQKESTFLHKMCVKLWSKFDFVSVTSLLSFNDIHSKFVTAENRACAFSHFAWLSRVCYCRCYANQNRIMQIQLDEAKNAVDMYLSFFWRRIDNKAEASQNYSIKTFRAVSK